MMKKLPKIDPVLDAVITRRKRFMASADRACYAELAVKEYERSEMAGRRYGAVITPAIMEPICKAAGVDTRVTALEMAWYYTQPLIEYSTAWGAVVDDTARDSVVSAELANRLAGAPQMVSFADKNLQFRGQRVVCALACAFFLESARATFQFVIYFDDDDKDVGVILTGGVPLNPEKGLTVQGIINHYFGKRPDEEDTADLIAAILNRAFFAVSDIPQAVEWRRTTKVPKAKKTKKFGLRIFPPEAPRRLLFAPPENINSVVREVIEGDGKRTVRPHIRKAHWHRFRVGSRSASIPTFKTIWLAPILVHSKEVKNG